MKSLQSFQVPAPEASFGSGNRRVIVGFAVRPCIGRISERFKALKGKSARQHRSATESFFTSPIRQKMPCLKLQTKTSRISKLPPGKTPHPLCLMSSEPEEESGGFDVTQEKIFLVNVRRSIFRQNESRRGKGRKFVLNGLIGAVLFCAVLVSAIRENGSSRLHADERAHAHDGHDPGSRQE